MSFDPQRPCPNEHVVSSEEDGDSLALTVSCVAPEEEEGKILSRRVFVAEDMDFFQQYAHTYISLVLCEHKNDLLCAEIERLQESDDA